jgi:hypothetical protein
MPTVRALLHRVELIAQRWRWDGRPVYELKPGLPPAPPILLSDSCGVPFTKLGTIDDFDGDALLFGAREDGDALVVPSQVEFASASAGKLPVHRLGWHDKAGVLYYRGAMRVHSRYAGLLRRPETIDSSAPVAGTVSRRWRRYARACSWRRDVPKPLVKLVVPLTEASGARGAPDAVPGWLVILDESWYGEQMAGIGEVFESGLLDVRLPDAADERRWQFGPDPIIAMDADPYLDWTVTLPHPLGAMGTTFDTDTQAPLFVSASFVQRPPQLVPPADRDPTPTAPDLSFHFAKLRFRRAIAGTEVADPRRVTMRSEWTDGYWVQILPPSNRWRLAPSLRVVDVIDLRYADATGRVLWHDETVLIAPTGPLEQPDESVARFEVLALLTRRIVDAFGRPDQEAFAEILPLSALTVLPRQRREGTVLRLVEVQFRLKKNDPPPLGGTEPAVDALARLVAALFPFDAERDSEDAKARIVRVSPPLAAALP